MGMETMGSYAMKSAKLRTKGFTLIASLLMLLLLSGIAIGLLMMVNTEGKVGGTDLQNNLAFHAAEGGIEKMGSDLAAVFQNSQVPTPTQICNVGGTSYQPSMVGVNWTQYSVTPQGLTCPPASGAALTATWGQISGGPNQGLWAQIIPINMLATASLMGGQEVSMTRGAQVALIPVFQYGVFCEGDCAFFDNPNLDFAGRVHANGDLYLGVYNGNTLTFHQKLEAYGNVVTEVLPNTLTINAGASADTGNVNIPTTAGGCSAPVAPKTAGNYPPTGLVNCVQKATNSDPSGSPYGNGSVQGVGGNPPASTYNGNPVTTGTSNWNAFSSSTNFMLINGNYGSTADPGTGAKKLSMPFVGGGVDPYEIIRRPPANELATSAVGTSREYNMAQIRVMLSDDPAELSASGAADSQNVRLANVAQTSTTATQYGVTMTAGNFGSTFTSATSYNLYFATASNGIPANCSSSTPCSDWPYPPAPWTSTVNSPSPLLVSNTAVAAPYDTSGSIPTLTAGSVTNLPTPVILCPNAAQLGHAPLTAANGGPYPAACPASPPNSTTGYYYYQTSPTTSVAFPSSNATTDAADSQTATWNLIDGWLRVEYLNKNTGLWTPVTNEWLSFGFARDVTPPNATTANPINPNAILLLQEPADRVSPGLGTPPARGATLAAGWDTTTATWTAPTCTATTRISGTTYCSAWSGATAPPVQLDSGGTGYWEFGPAGAAAQSATQFNWYPINFYDAREGEPRDVITNNDSCTTNGVMNAVEIDVGNLQNWLSGAIPGSGTNVNYTAQNGYVLYFSDRRGMLLNPTVTSTHPAGTKSGDSGLEDVVNSSSAAGTPDGALQTPVTASPEDVNLNGALDNFGTRNLGLGFYGTVNSGTTNLNYQIVNSPTAPDPYGTAAGARIASCGATARKNWVSGARHVLKLVDGALGNVPLSPVSTVKNGVTYWGGFTVASENPVYIQGDYNSSAADTFFSGANGSVPGADAAGHSAAAVIADAVTILSDAWDDRASTFLTPSQPQGDRTATTTYYRLAVAGGKNLAFPFPSWANANPDYAFATDGGIGNFLRFLEDWNGQTLNYGGSLVSLYYATYNTGLFKCCTYSVYLPPTRNYYFDSDFTLPEGLPPGTPLFRDVETLSYRQLFATRQSTQ